MSLPPDAVWFVTGASSGFGRLIAERALAAGFRVVATARDPAGLADLGGGDAGRLLRLGLDVTVAAEIGAAVASAEARFGAIDVLVNNAGYGYFGAVEEGEEAEIRRLFDSNVFGLAAVTRAVLPGLRRRRRGVVVNLSSIAGLTANPGVGYYAASKFAVEAISEALAAELAPFGGRVLIVEPGPFRTDFAGRSIRRAPADPAYAGTRAHEIPDAILASSGRQEGDPDKAVALIIEAVLDDGAPLRLPLGETAIVRARAKLAAVERDIAAWETRAVATDFG